MASQPHDKTGKHCFLCKRVFTKQSATFTISFKEPNLIIKRCVCGDCHHKHMAQGE